MSFILQRLLLFLCISSVAVAQQQSDPPQTARIEGTIVDVAGNPLAGVQVRLTAPAVSVNGLPTQPLVFAANTDPTGKFIIVDITPRNDYRLTAQREGYVTASYGAISNPPNPIPL